MLEYLGELHQGIFAQYYPEEASRWFGSFNSLQYCAIRQLIRRMCLYTDYHHGYDVKPALLIEWGLTKEDDVPALLDRWLHTDLNCLRGIQLYCGSDYCGPYHNQQNISPFNCFAWLIGEAFLTENFDGYYFQPRLQVLPGSPWVLTILN
jgi:hypothetical protein